MCGRHAGGCRKNLLRLLIIGLLIAFCREKKKRGHSVRGVRGSHKNDGWGYTDWSAL